MAFACMSAGLPPRHCPSQEIELFGLTSLGIVHTAISLGAVAAGVMAFFRYREILARTMLGKVYAVTTMLTRLTGCGIFQHGGFGKPHVLGIVTLLVLLAPWQANAEAPELKATIAVRFALFLVGAALQVRCLRAVPAAIAAAAKTVMPAAAVYIQKRNRPLLTGGQQRLVDGLVQMLQAK